MTKRYVSGKRNGELQSMHGDNARDLLRARARSPSWYDRQYPLIFELVPVDAEKLKPKKRRRNG